MLTNRAIVALSYSKADKGLLDAARDKQAIRLQALQQALALGANVNVQDRRNEGEFKWDGFRYTALMWAAYRGKFAMVQYLMEYNQSLLRTTPTFAVQRPSAKGLKKIPIPSGSIIVVATPTAAFFLLHAPNGKHKILPMSKAEMADCFLGKAVPTIVKPFDLGLPLLKRALRAVGWLVDPYIMDNHKNTAVHIAIKSGQSEIAKYLLQAEPELLDFAIRQQKPVLPYAIRYQQTSIQDLLQEKYDNPYFPQLPLKVPNGVLACMIGFLADDPQALGSCFGLNRAWRQHFAPVRPSMLLIAYSARVPQHLKINAIGPLWHSLLTQYYYVKLPTQVSEAQACRQFLQRQRTAFLIGRAVRVTKLRATGLSGLKSAAGLTYLSTHGGMIEPASAVLSVMSLMDKESVRESRSVSQAELKACIPDTVYAKAPALFFLCQRKAVNYALAHRSLNQSGDCIEPTIITLRLKSEFSFQLWPMDAQGGCRMSTKAIENIQTIQTASDCQKTLQPLTPRRI